MTNKYGGQCPNCKSHGLVQYYCKNTKEETFNCKQCGFFDGFILARDPERKVLAVDAAGMLIEESSPLEHILHDQPYGFFEVEFSDSEDMEYCVPDLACFSDLLDRFTDDETVISMRLTRYKDGKFSVTDLL